MKPYLSPLRLLWVGYAIICALVTISGPFLNWNAMQRPCRSDATCPAFQLDQAAVHTLGAHGITMTMFALYNVSAGIIAWAIWYGTAALILRRKPANRGALVTAFFLVTIPAAASLSKLVPSSNSGIPGDAAVIAIVLLCLLFPDGRFASRWAAALAGIMAACMVVGSLPISSGPVSSVIGSNLLLALFVLIVVSQIHRYRKLSSWTERQQTKVAMVGVAIAVLGIAALWFPYGIAPFPTGNGSLYNNLSNDSGPFLILSALPITIGIAMLRHGLWEIDRVINRALVYTVLTVILAGLYVGFVLGLQTLFGLVVGHASSLAIAVSTLAIAALFGPLRSLVQRGIDRRFYRSRYDAGQILNTLQSRLANETSIDRLSDEILSVIEETIHPDTVTLWLRPAQ